MRRQYVDIYGGLTSLGIDVSHWNGEVDWEKVAGEQPLRPVEFAFIRTGDGQDEDRRFAQNWVGAKDAVLIRGVYHFFRADRDGKTQAEAVLERIYSAGGFNSTDFTVALDFERGVSKNLPGGVFTLDAPQLPIALVVEECLEFLSVIMEQLGVRPMVYTGEAFHWWLSQAVPVLAAEFGPYPLWTPFYGAAALRKGSPKMPVNVEGDAFPWAQWDIWQYSSKGVVKGVAGPCDMNLFRGDLAQLQAFMKSLRVSGDLVVVDPVGATREALWSRARGLQSDLDVVLNTLEDME